jgi:hypothetical protein
MALDSITHIPCNIEHMSSVNSQDPGHGVVYRGTNNIRIGTVTSEMEMLTVPSDDLRLATFGKLNISDSTNGTVRGLTGNHEVGSVVFSN